MSEIAQKCTEGNRETSVQRFRAFSITSYEDSPPVFDSEGMKYLCYARESCPTTGRQHWQTYVYFYYAKTIKATHKIFGNCWVQQSRGTPEQNQTYCKGPYQDGEKVKPLNPEFYEFGTLPSQGQRGDLDKVKDKIMNGSTTVVDIITNNPMMYHQYGRTLEKIEDIALSKKFRNFMTKGIWISGGTSIGKSHIAFKGYNPETHYLWRDDNGWWCGYHGQPIVIINDFRGEIKYNELLQMVDKWPYNVPRRNRPPTPFVSRTVIITSSLTPEQVYHNRLDEDNIAQLRRRFTFMSEEVLKIRQEYNRLAPGIEIILED